MEKKRERRKREYRKVKEVFKKITAEVQKKQDEDLAMKLSEDFVTNRILYHKMSRMLEVREVNRQTE